MASDDRRRVFREVAERFDLYDVRDPPEHFDISRGDIEAVGAPRISSQELSSILGARSAEIRMQRRSTSHGRNRPFANNRQMHVACSMRTCRKLAIRTREIAP